MDFILILALFKNNQLGKSGLLFLLLFGTLLFLLFLVSETRKEIRKYLPGFRESFVEKIFNQLLTKGIAFTILFIFGYKGYKTFHQEEINDFSNSELGRVLILIGIPLSFYLILGLVLSSAISETMSSYLIYKYEQKFLLERQRIKEEQEKKP